MATIDDIKSSLAALQAVLAQLLADVNELPPDPAPSSDPAPSPDPAPAPDPIPVPTPDPAPATDAATRVTESASGTTITDGNGQIVDSSKAIWKIVNGVVQKNGTNAGYTASVVFGLYWQGVFYQQNNAKGWWKWSSNTWADAADPRPSKTESASGTTITDGAGQIVDSNTDVWTIAAGVVQKNGTNAGYTANVVFGLYWQGVFYQQNNAKGWWKWSSNAWADASDPRGNPSPAPNPAPQPSPTPPSGNVVKVDLSANQGTISPYVWGVGTEGFNSPGSNDYGAAINGGFATTYKQQNWRLFRFNTEGTVGPWINNASPTNNWFNGAKNWWDTANNRLMFTLGSANQDVSPDAAVSIANYFRKNNMECFHYEFWNEPDGADVNTYCQKFNAVQKALKGVNSNYKLGGPTTTYNRGDWLGTFAKQCKPDFISWHTYFTGSYNDNASLFSTALSRSANDVKMARQYFPDKSIPLFLGEWNIDYNGADQMMQTIDGAIFGSCFTYAALATDPNVTMGSIWCIGQNSNFTIINNDGSNVRPFGQVLGVLGRKMGGTKASLQIGNGMSKLFGMASYNGSNWAVWLTNYDLNNSVSINVQGLTGDNYQYWECSPAHGQPLTSSKSASSLANLTIPARSVVVLSSN